MKNHKDDLQSNDLKLETQNSGQLGADEQDIDALMKNSNEGQNKQKMGDQDDILDAKPITQSQTINQDDEASGIPAAQIIEKEDCRSKTL